MKALNDFLSEEKLLNLENVVIYETEDRVAKIILNRPKESNSINLQMPTQLKYYIEKANRDDNIHVNINIYNLNR
jgi:enoyl-CoA hydratase/carnithine racemase